MLLVPYMWASMTFLPMSGSFCPIFLIYLLHATLKHSIFGCKPLSFVSVALRIDFSIPHSFHCESSHASFIVP